MSSLSKISLLWGSLLALACIDPPAEKVPACSDCGPSASCSIDAECDGGYCLDSACVSGSRPTCATPADCPGAGRCLVSQSQCVECLFDADCPEGLTCNDEHHCQTAPQGCTASACASQGKICAPQEAACRDCLSSAECGTRACIGGTCKECTSDEQCGVERHCDDGVCVANDAIACETNVDCGNKVCRLDGEEKRCLPCLLAAECGGERTCDDGLCSNDTECTADSECETPHQVCSAGSCTEGCMTSGCGADSVCSETTGRCVPTAQTGAELGAECSKHSECASGVCWPFATLATGAEQAQCGQACSIHTDCPSDFACLELGDSNFCTPKERFAPAPLNRDPGAACEVPVFDTACATGYCDPMALVCLAMCGRDADCAAGEICYTWAIDFATVTQVCQPANPALLGPGGSCGFQLGVGTYYPDSSACESGLCVQTADDSVPPSCAEPCCTPNDCSPGASVCKPVDTLDGSYEPGEPIRFQKMCLWREYAGTKELGSVCSQDSECKSEICLAGELGVKRCTQTCCSAADCAGFDWAQACRPPFAGSTVGDDNLVDMAKSLGRQSGFGTVAALGQVCVPK